MGQFAGFQKVKLQRPSRSTFDLSHDKRLSMRMGRLTPVLCVECVPSDSFNGSTEMLVRLAPLLAPIYDNIEVFVHYFFVPNRLLWEGWEEMITGGRLGVGIDPATAPVPPYFDIQAVLDFDGGSLFAKSSLADYLGVPIFADITGASYTGTGVDAMPFLAYQLIWFEYYRDRNFVDDEAVAVTPAVDGAQTAYELMMRIKTRAYKHDYFTSALPFTQRGEEVLIPLDGSVEYMDQSIIRKTSDGLPYEVNGYLGVTEPPQLGGVDGGTIVNVLTSVPPSTGTNVHIENIESISNISTTINDFRSAYALQVWLERNAIAGSRYTESVQAHFGVRPQDMRVQRPEYLGGGRINVRISEVVSTAYSQDGDSQTVPLANMGGHGVSYGNTNNFRYFCVEHGFIVGIASIMNPPSYHQGLPRMFFRKTFLDYPWPTFAKLGEQQVDKAELFATPANLTPDADGVRPLFGYQSRYADWKYLCNSNHGDFHDTLLFWTLTRHFTTSPELGIGFVTFDESSQERIFAVQGESDNFWVYAHNRVHVKRPLPYFGTPNTLGFV